jgi:hypothetical protein
MASPRSEDTAISIMPSFEPPKKKMFVVYNLKYNLISPPF